MNLIISIHVHVGLLLKFQVVGYIYSYVISRRGIVLPCRKFFWFYTCILLLFPMRVVGAHAHSRRGKSLVPVS